MKERLRIIEQLCGGIQAHIQTKESVRGAEIDISRLIALLEEELDSPVEPGPSNYPQIGLDSADRKKSDSDER